MPVPKWAHEDVSAMHDYDWPGNIRELKNLIERCILLGKPPAHYWRELHGYPVAIEVTTSPKLNDKMTHSDIVVETSGTGYPNHWTLKEVEKAHIMQIVDFYEGNKSAAARDLGVARKTLERKFKEWDGDEQDNLG